MKKELAQKLYDWYLESIQMIMGMIDIYSIHDICRERTIESGICWCSSQRYGIDIYHDEWVQSGGNYWTTPVEWCDTKEEVIDALQFRVDRLKEYIDTH